VVGEGEMKLRKRVGTAESRNLSFPPSSQLTSDVIAIESNCLATASEQNK
jgi:hypothetical protein